MKRKNRLGWAWLCIALFFPTCFQAQNPLWTFPEQYFQQGNALNLPTDDYNGDPADRVHAGYQDPYGDLMFFKVDDYIYNEGGTETGWFYDGTDPITGTSEALIVPKPGSCNEFYIFQAEAEGSFLVSEYPHMSVYNDSVNSLAWDPNNSSQTTWNLVTDPNLGFIENWGSTEHGVHGVHFAATKERESGDRFVYVSNNQRVWRADLTCDGIVDPNWSYTLHSNDEMVETGWRTELELYEDTADNAIKIAQPYFLNDATNGHIKIAVFEVDSATGNFLTGSRIDIQMENINGPNTAAAYVHGVEFSPDGSILYIMHEPTTNYPAPLSYYNFSTSTLSNLNCSNISDFTKSQLQINGDSANYTLYMASDDYLGTLDDPDNPNCNNWTWNSIPLNSYGTNDGATGPFFVGGIKHIVPDQVDYQDYVETFLAASCDCCYKYAYADEKQDTSYSAVINDSWGPGINNNPWDAMANDTIYIRDSLFIPKGLSVTITDLNFAFGRDAVVVLQRGNSTTPGAVLSITDSTLFTFDFRCSEREYNCPDPSDEDCARKYWQGVRVEGSRIHPQSLSGFTRQSKFYMNKGSRIEYAKVGILAGHEVFSNYGGGIVRIDESTMKDNITGVRFDPYIRTVSGQEVMTLSEIEDMNFTWTADLPSGSEPFRHIDIRELSGLEVRAGVYQNEDFASYSPSDRGIGIYSSNSALECTWYCDPFPSIPCDSEDERRPEFLNLHRGVEGLGLSGRLIEVYYAFFRNNVAGVFLSNQINPRILDNEFYIPNADNNFGLFLGSSTGYTVENNYFTSLIRGASPKWTYGISVMSSGPANNEIYKNVFEDITIGIINSKQNADCSKLDDGLRWRCNEFNQFIPYADIFVTSGVVSDDQGSCAGSSSTLPAGNVFSHSHGGSPTAGPYDIKVDENNQPYTDCPGSPNLEIVYRYHGSLSGSYQARMKPIIYTAVNGHVQPVQCTFIPVDGSTCKVQNTSVPGAIDTPGGGGPKSNGSETSFWELDSLSFEQMNQLISDHYASKNDALAQLDNGNTSSLLSAIDAEDYDLVSELISAAGEMLSYRVIEALFESGNAEFESIAMSAVFSLIGQEVSDSTYQMVDLPSWETETILSDLERMEPHLWKRLIYENQKDTLNEFSNESVMALFETYQPESSGHRFVATLAQNMGVEEPVWINSNSSLNQEVESYSFVESDDGLPRDVYNYVSADFYNQHSNMASLNELYVSAGASYDPPVFEFPDIILPEPPEDSNKSIRSNTDESENRIIVMPNPFDQIVTFDFSDVVDDESDMQLVFYDVVGKRIHSQVIPAGQRFVQISGEKLTEGFIHYTLISEGARIESGTIVKMK